MPKKIVYATFENENCMACQYLPVCFGPCSQKISTVKNPGDIEKFCFKGGISDTLNYIMTEFEKSNRPMGQLLDYK